MGIGAGVKNTDFLSMQVTLNCTDCSLCIVRHIRFVAFNFNYKEKGGRWVDRTMSVVGADRLISRTLTIFKFWIRNCIMSPLFLRPGSFFLEDTR
jgi:hypothetical protein